MGAEHGLLAGGDVEDAVVSQQRPASVAIGEPRQLIEESRLERVDLDLLGLVDGAGGGLSEQKPRIVLGEHHHARRRFAGLVQAIGGRRPDLDPGPQVALQIADLMGGSSVDDRPPFENAIPSSKSSA